MWDCRWTFRNDKGTFASIVGLSQRSSSVLHFGRRVGTEHGAAVNRGCHMIGKNDSPQQTRWWREGHRDWRCGETIGGPHIGAAVE